MRNKANDMAYPPFNPWQNAPFGQNTPAGFDSLHMQQQAMLQQQQMLLEQQHNKLHAMTMAQDLGRLVTMRRTSLGLGHEQLASLSGISAYEIMQIESGNMNSISMEKCFMVMAALRLNLSAYAI